MRHLRAQDASPSCNYPSSTNTCCSFVLLFYPHQLVVAGRSRVRCNQHTNNTSRQFEQRRCSISEQMAVFKLPDDQGDVARLLGSPHTAKRDIPQESGRAGHVNHDRAAVRGLRAVIRVGACKDGHEGSLRGSERIV